MEKKSGKREEENRREEEEENSEITGGPRPWLYYHNTILVESFICTL